MQKTKLRIATVMLIAIAMIGAVAAIVHFETQVPNTFSIHVYGVSLWRIDTNVAVTDLAWGEIVPGTQKTTDDVLGVQYKLSFKNTGDIAGYPQWNITGSTLPAGVTFTCQYVDSMGPPVSWLNYPADSNIFNVPAGTVVGVIRFTLTVAANSPRGDYAFSLNVNLC